MRRPLEVEEHLVLRERQAVRSLELAIELVDEPGVGAEEAAPGRELER